MNRINPIDFGELLEEMGYVVQDDTGEVYTPADNQPFWEAQRLCNFCFWLSGKAVYK